MSGGETAMLNIITQLSKTSKNVLITNALGEKTYRNLLPPNIEIISINAAIKERRMPWTIGSLLHSLFRFLIICPRLNIERGSVVIQHGDVFTKSIASRALKNHFRLSWIAINHMLCPPLFKGFEHAYSGKHRLPSVSFLLYWLSQKLFFLLSRSADALVTVNTGYLDYFKKWNTQTHVIKLAANHPARPASIPEKKYDAVYIGRFHPQKGIYDLIETAACLKQKHPDLLIAVAGDYNNPLGRRFKNRLEHAGLTAHFRLLGHLSEQEKDSALAASRILLFPSRYESFGLVYLEAIRLGVPVVEYDIPVFHDHKEGCLKAEPFNTDDFARQADELLSDAKLHSKLAHAGMNYARTFSWEQTAQELSHIISITENKLYQDTRS